MGSTQSPRMILATHGGRSAHGATRLADVAVLVQPIGSIGAVSAAESESSNDE